MESTGARVVDPSLKQAAVVGVPLNQLSDGSAQVINVMVCRVWDSANSYGKYLSTDFLVCDKEKYVLNLKLLFKVGKNSCRDKSSHPASIDAKDGHEPAMLTRHARSFLLLNKLDPIGKGRNQNIVYYGVLLKDMVCWTGMVACYAENGCFEDALALFSKMRMTGLMPNNYTFAGVLKACIGLEEIQLGKAVHGCVLKTCYENGSFVGIALLELYTEFGLFKDARQVFQDMPRKDLIAWSLMIARHAQNDRGEEAVAMFCKMMQALDEN